MFKIHVVHLRKSMAVRIREYQMKQKGEKEDTERERERERERKREMKIGFQLYSLYTRLCRLYIMHR
jgi:hypothetical protein